MKRLPALFAILALLSSFALAQPGKPGGPAGKGPNPDCPFGKHDGKGPQALKEQIGLSDDQMKKLEATRLESKKTALKSKNEIEMEKLALQEAALKGTITKARIKESLKKIEEQTRAMHAARFQAAASAVDIFTDDQLKKMADKKMLGMLIQFRGGMGGHGPEGECDPNCPHLKNGGKGGRQCRMHGGHE